MSNPFDNKIKESLEKFEMPYDANAWAEFEKQLPQGGGAATSGSQFGWKAAALVAVLAVSVATIWYLNTDKEVAISESATIERVDTSEEPSVSVEENSSQLTEPALEVKEPTKVASSEKTQTANSKIAEDEAESTIETTPANSKDTEKVISSEINNSENETATTTKKTTPKTEATQPLEAGFIASTVKACVGEEVGFINQSSDMKAKMTWDFGDGTMSNELNPSHSFVTAGNYEVILRTERGEKKADRMITLTVNPSPVADIEFALVKEGYEAIPFYQFETVLKPNETADWTFTDGFKAQTAAVNHLFRNAGKQQATLTIKNSFGCSASDQWEIENRKAFQLLAPTGFKPDGDGNNDAFMPGALSDMDVDFEMVILDQKGQEVYRTGNSSEPWNGKLNNHGNKLDAGIYVWTVVLKEEIAYKKTFTGTITLLR